MSRNTSFSMLLKKYLCRICVYDLYLLGVGFFCLCVIIRPKTYHEGHVIHVSVCGTAF